MERKLKIAQVAPLWFSIPPKKYGGTERIIYFLTEGLIKRGHKVTLFASGDSRTSAKLISVVEKSLTKLGIDWKEYVWNSFNTARAIEMGNKFDIIHTHWCWVPFYFSKLTKTPIVHTFHNLPKKEDTRWKMLKYYKDRINAVFISKSEKLNSQIKFKTNTMIYNGIDISQFKFNKNPEDYFLWVGRIDPIKGPKTAILAAKKAKVKLFLVGPVQEIWKDYFQKEIKPHLSQKIKYLGELSQSQLVKIYARAKALLYPIEWEEPFGLVMVEAMACGTPVIVFNRGSAKEIVKDGETGFVVENLKEMVEAIKKVNKISRFACRQRVEKYFSVETMVRNYERLYYKILRK